MATNKNKWPLAFFLLWGIIPASVPGGGALSAALTVSVTEEQTGAPLPCRITITDHKGMLAALEVESQSSLAVRPGVIYTRDGRVEITLAPGIYTVCAGRGFEYSLDTRKLSLSGGESRQLALRIRREVPTEGLISCDTHVHTLTHSGHGDATLEERLVTIAGEGLEMPVATDHNRQIDYSEAAARLGSSRYFTAAVGNEITTRRGHFNAFPMPPGGPVPDAGQGDWTRLFESIRVLNGGATIILNHPRDLHGSFRPFDPSNFNPVSGRSPSGLTFTFDAMEVMNSGALQSDLMQLYGDWFAILNSGRRIVAVGSSDCHDVNRYIVGQSRTYIAARDADPGKIDLEEACRNLKAGRALVSMGLLVELRVNGRFVSGDLAAKTRDGITAVVTVKGPSWTRADRVALFANGIKIREERIARSENRVVKSRVTWELPAIRHDVHLVAIASGPGITEPFWPIAQPYQPTSPVWVPRVIGSTNPVWVDGDGDGQFTYAREYAERAVRSADESADRLMQELAEYDEAIAAQAADRWHETGHDIRGNGFARMLSKARPHVRRGFAAYARTMEPARK